MRNLFTILILTNLFIYACGYEYKEDKCNVQEDCEKGLYCSNQNRCESNECPRFHDCGKGKCVETPNGAKCECSENAVLVEEWKKCVPTCSTYSEECANFGVNINECNMEKGHCDTQCQGKGSCPKGQECFSGVCDKASD